MLTLVKLLHDNCSRLDHRVGYELLVISHIPTDNCVSGYISQIPITEQNLDVRGRNALGPSHEPCRMSQTLLIPNNITYKDVITYKVVAHYSFSGGEGRESIKNKMTFFTGLLTWVVLQ